MSAWPFARLVSAVAVACAIMSRALARSVAAAASCFVSVTRRLMLKPSSSSSPSSLPSSGDDMDKDEASDNRRVFFARFLLSLAPADNKKKRSKVTAETVSGNCAGKERERDIRGGDL